MELTTIYVCTAQHFQFLSTLARKKKKERNEEEEEKKRNKING